MTITLSPTETEACQTAPAAPNSREFVPDDREPAPDPVESAKAAGLRYVTDEMRGISRERSGDRFIYLGPGGRVIRDSEELQRFKSLGIPPAWTDVWICPLTTGHLQATGRDAKDRKQYRYHPRWRAVRDETKFHRMITFAETLPQIRQRVARDLARPGLPREKVLAAVVRLLETTTIRVGNEEYVRENHHFGLTTLRNRHAEVTGATLRFHFTGKSGKRQRVELHDRRLAQIVKRCREIPGHHLFEYPDEQGQSHAIGSGDVNDYLREISGQDFTAKEFRTWAGSVLAVRALRECGLCESVTQGKKNIVYAVDTVTERLGNTRVVCRKYYIHPAVIEAYLDGSLLELCRVVERPSPDRQGGDSGLTHALSPEETAVLSLLRQVGGTRAGAACQNPFRERARREGAASRRAPSGRCGIPRPTQPTSRGRLSSGPRRAWAGSRRPR